jgi:hypothetical protein
MKDLWYLIPIGVCVIAAACMVGPAMYPPGEGYAEERRNDRITLALIVLGTLLIAIPFLYEIWSNP